MPVHWANTPSSAPLALMVSITFRMPAVEPDSTPLSRAMTRVISTRLREMYCATNRSSTSADTPMSVSTGLMESIITRYTAMVISPTPTGARVFISVLATAALSR